MEWERLISEANWGTTEAQELAELVTVNNDIGSLEYRLQLLFSIFSQKPSYFTSYCLVKLYDKFDAELKSKFWDRFVNELESAEGIVSDELKYLLWVEFFRDKLTVNEAWNQILKRSTSNEVIGTLLNESGPVPFDLKLSLYRELIDNEKWHRPILLSIHHSLFDITGNVNIDDAKMILNQLQVDKSDDYYKEVNRRLSI
ncbi:MAG: hypothetical protein JXQ87_06325 [Bacteroidia bacterium]